jgi:hypothetical protein
VEAGVIEIGVALQALERRSGDRAVTVEYDRGALVAAIDGLGHGDAAADAADAAAEVLEASPREPLEDLLTACHEALDGTRGAVMTLCRFDGEDNTLCWVGVGNVEGRLLRAGTPPAAGGTNAPVLFGGVVGHLLPSVRSSVQELMPGDVVVLASDGVRSDFASELAPSGPVQKIAESVLEQSARGGDDALVVVVRWLGDLR